MEGGGDPGAAQRWAGSPVNRMKSAAFASHRKFLRASRLSVAVNDQVPSLDLIGRRAGQDPIAATGFAYLPARSPTLGAKVSSLIHRALW